MADRQDAERRLGTTERRAESAEAEARRRAQDLALASERALEAERKARESDAARGQAETEAERMRRQSEAATSMAQHALHEKEQAVASRRQVTEELEQVRQRREAELNRMQEALNRVAPTQRTPTGMVMQLADEAFRFDFDSAALKPENRETLSRIAGVLLASEGYRLFIDGHTDDIGTDEYNRDLSRRRANSVRDYLVRAGIPAEIVTVKGFGKSNPLVQAKTRDARAKNRRVEIGVVDTIINYGGEVKTAGTNP
jgi:outer membrane protein OmpA-like peptidoglycan-associated protein